MGFDVTAANIIFFIAMLTVGSVALGAYWKNADHVEDARRLQEERVEARAHTNLTIESTTYDAGLDRFTVDIKNHGATVVDISSLVYFVDGVLLGASSLEGFDVDGASTTTDILLPMETLEVRLAPIASAPEAFQVVDENGVSANWRS